MKSIKLFFIISLAITYYYNTVGTVFYCTIKYKRSGSPEIKEHKCLFDKNKGLKDVLEELEGQEVILVKDKTL